MNYLNQSSINQAKLNNANQLWSEILSEMESEVSAILYEMQLAPLQPVEIIGSKLILLAPNEKNRTYIMERHLDKLEEKAHKINNFITDIEIYTEDTLKKNTGRAFSKKEFIRHEPVVLSQKYTFENFVVGQCNQFVAAAARAVAEDPGKRYNPLFIYGGTGLGKTHILQAIGNELKLCNPKLIFNYVTCEKFTNDFIEAIRFGNDKNTFRDKYRCVDVLVVDDIQFIADKEGTQEEFFHTFNELYQNGKQIVIASDRPPKEINPLEERLRSRFEGGLITDIQPPDFETRLAILQRKTMNENYNISSEVLSFMAEKIVNNVRELESMLGKVVFLARLTNSKPTIEIVKEALKDFSSNQSNINSDKIIAAVCSKYFVKREDLIGKKKNKEIVEPRQVAIYLIDEMLNLPLSAIGHIFGGRDHTTIMHSRNKITEMLKNNIKLKIKIQDIKNSV